MMLSGACDVDVDDGRRKVSVALSSPAMGLYVPAMHWIDLHNFTPHAVCMVLASDVYDEADYIRERAEFDRLVKRDVTTT